MAVGTSGEPSQVRRLVGELIRIHRVRAGLTQKDAADQLLISESLMGAVERAERIPTLELLADTHRIFVAGGALKACIELIDAEKYPAKFLGWARPERQARVISERASGRAGFRAENAVRTPWPASRTRESRPPRNFPGAGGFVCEAVTGFEPV